MPVEQFKPRDEVPGRLAYSRADLRTAIPLSPRSIDKLLSTGELPSVRIGGRRFVLAEDLRAFLNSKREAA